MHIERFIVDSAVETPTRSFVWTGRKAGGNAKSSELILVIVGSPTGDVHG